MGCSAVGSTVCAFAGSSGGGGAVTSVFGRIGAVVAVAGDYAASLVANDSAVAGAFVSDALNALAAAILASVPASRQINTGVGLDGGGNLGADLTLVTRATVQAGSGAAIAVNALTTHLVIDVSGGAASVQLPDPAVRTAPIKIKANGDAQSNPITLLRFGGEGIDGLAVDYVFSAAWGAFELVSDGVNWWVF
jgi:hypothetical protein